MKNPTPPGDCNGAEQISRLTAPGARAVLLAADFTHWQEQALPMTPMAAGLWSRSATLPPGSYHYHFLVDGEWRDDPEWIRCVPNVFGDQNMVREVPATSSPATAAPSRIRSRRPTNRKHPAPTKTIFRKPQSAGL